MKVELPQQSELLNKLVLVYVTENDAKTGNGLEGVILRDDVTDDCKVTVIRILETGRILVQRQYHSYKVRWNTLEKIGLYLFAAGAVLVVYAWLFEQRHNAASYRWFDGYVYTDVGFLCSLIAFVCIVAGVAIHLAIESISADESRRN